MSVDPTGEVAAAVAWFASFGIALVTTLHAGFAQRGLRLAPNLLLAGLLALGTIPLCALGFFVGALVAVGLQALSGIVPSVTAILVAGPLAALLACPGCCEVVGALKAAGLRRSRINKLCVALLQWGYALLAASIIGLAAVSRAMV